MKKFRVVLVLLLVALLATLVACGEQDPQGDKQTFTVTFDTQGGSVVAPLTIVEGEAFTLPQNPTKEGYVFDGWYLSTDFLEEFNTTHRISSDITVYAKWKTSTGGENEKKSYTITFDTQGGSEIKPVVLKEGQIITLPSNPVKEGYMFGGWYLDSACTQALDGTTHIDRNMVLYAKWKVSDDGQTLISSDYFSLNGLVLTMNKDKYISSSEEVFDLQNKFSTSVGAQWRAFMSESCDESTEITTRKMNVSAGWNDVYVKVENPTTHNNRIYRLRIYKYPEIVYYELNGGFLGIQSVSDCEDVLFPDETINRITQIGSGAFTSCPSLRTIENLPNLIKIEQQAFANCENLASITIPENVTYISPDAFYGCTGLTTVNWNATAYTSEESPIFSGFIYANLSTLNIGENVTIIPSNSFMFCSLKNIRYDGDIAGWLRISGGVGGAFSESRTLYIDGKKVEGELIIPNGVTSIGGYAFRLCTELTSVIIPDSVIGIDDGAFQGCKGLTSITIPDSVTSIGESAFYNTAWYDNQPDGLVYAGKVVYKYKGTMPENTTITIKEGTLGIAGGAFKQCRGLTSITIPDSVTNIGEWAFYNCTGLTSITIPDSVMSIGNRAFDNYDRILGLTSIYYTGDIAGWCGISGLGSLMTSSRTLYIGGNKVEGELIIPDSVTCVADSAFEGCTRLTSITIPDSVTSIGSSAFEGCTRLTSITIPDCVMSIGSYAFDDTAWYNNQPDGLVYAGKVAYKYKGTMPENTTITIKEGTLGIAGAAFTNCTGLTSIVIPDSVTNIGNAFSGCTGLTSITIPDSVTSIGDHVFYNTAWYDNQPDGLVYAGKVAYGYKGTMSINTTIKLKDGTLGIAGAAFRSINSYRLTSITIPDSVTSIGDSAFEDCNNLSSINFDGTMAQWNAIEKGEDWKYNVPSSCKVICTDGELSL